MCFGLLAYAFGCLLLVIFLSQRPPQGEPTLPEISDLVGTTQMPNFATIKPSAERKRAFAEMLIPMIEQKNNYILHNRHYLQQMKLTLAQGKLLTAEQKNRLDTLRKRYHVTREVYPDKARAIEILLLRADIIPQSMVLAQAAIESGWGRSRFALNGNSLFGQWCYTPGCGLVPKQRAVTANHEVRRFASVEASLDAYYRNINTHNAYRALRRLRASLREKYGEPAGLDLVMGLEKYSSRGSNYINQLRSLIKANRFEKVYFNAIEDQIEVQIENQTEPKISDIENVSS